MINAIANGKTKYNEIQSATGMSDISFCLKNLMSSEIVEKRKSSKPYYIIADTMLDFYFRYVMPGASLINSGKGKAYYMKKVKPNLHEFMGRVFEKMAKEYILNNVGTKKVPAFVTDVVEYQSSIKIGKELKSIEIDILGLDGKKIVLAGECKFKSEKFGKDDYELFMEKIIVHRSFCSSPNSYKLYFIFSQSFSNVFNLGLEKNFKIRKSAFIHEIIDFFNFLSF